MTSPITLGLNDVLERLGQKTGLLPDLQPGVQPVILFGDLTSTLATELFEARGHFVWLEDNLPANTAAIVALKSLAPGGCVVEQLSFRVDPKGTSDFLRLEIFPPGGSFVPNGSFQNIGGIECASGIEYLQAAGGSFGTAGWPIALYPEISIYPSHIYVPSGALLEIGLNTNPVAGRRFDGFMVWREMTAIPGRA